MSQPAARVLWQGAVMLDDSDFPASERRSPEDTYRIVIAPRADLDRGRLRGFLSWTRTTKRVDLRVEGLAVEKLAIDALGGSSWTPLTSYPARELVLEAAIVDVSGLLTRAMEAL